MDSNEPIVAWTHEGQSYKIWKGGEHGWSYTLEYVGKDGAVDSIPAPIGALLERMKDSFRY